MTNPSPFPFKGTGVALVTPFDEGKIDFEALAKVVEHCISGGVEFLVALGSTGEAVTLNATEQQEVLNFVRERNAGRIPLVAGFSGSDTDDMIKRFKEYDMTGVDGLLVSSPSYNKPPQSGIIEHYKAFAAQTDLPIILYNVPGRTGSNMMAQTTITLAEEVENIVAIKEASGNLEQIMDIIKGKPDGFEVLSGDDPLTLPMLGVGGKGVISVIANAFPNEFSGMVRAALRNDYDEARQLHYALHPIHPHLYVEGNPAGIKGAMSILGLCNSEVRMPLRALSYENRQKLEKAMEPVMNSNVLE